MLQSCSNDSAIAEASSPVGLADLSGELIEAAQISAKHFSPPGEPRLPADVSAHLQTQFESFSLEALLFTDQFYAGQLSTDNGDQAPGRVPAAALIAQIDRYALPPEEPTHRVAREAARKPESQWQYDGIMRSSVFVDAVASSETAQENADAQIAETINALGFIERVETVQRMALDLAGATSQSLWVGRDRINIVVSEQDLSSCNRSYRWEATLSSQQHIALDFDVAGCPAIRALGELHTWAESGVEVSGTLTSQRASREPLPIAVTGTAWVRQSWGNVPTAAGAVVIDSLTISLDDGSTLDVTRSRRRSGRGPQTVSATLHTKKQGSTMMNVAWEDSAEQFPGASGSFYPANVTLRSDDGLVDISALVMNRISESTIGLDVRAHVPVVVSGTHTGAGFLSFTALPEQQ